MQQVIIVRGSALQKCELSLVADIFMYHMFVFIMSLALH